MLYAVIVAGGRGTRLWPASRTTSPKQVKPFVGDRTMLQRTYERVCQVVPPENVLVVTNVIYKDEIRLQLPNLSSGQFILEPEARNTAPAVGLAAAVLAKRDPEATMINVWSDHFIRHEDEYKNKILLADEILKNHPQYLIDIVAKPEYAATGYGYLEAGEELAQHNGVTVYKAARFVEKPDLETAQRYLASGKYFWNTAIFVWKAKTLLDMYGRYVPAMYEGIMEIQAAWDTPQQEKIMQEFFPTLDKISIDYAIFEKTPNIALIPADLGWRDVGSWQAVYDILVGVDTGKGVVQKGKVVALDTEDTLIFNENKDKLVAVVGLKDIVIVDTPDSLLVMKKSQDQDVKKIVEKIEQDGELEHL